MNVMPAERASGRTCDLGGLLIMNYCDLGGLLIMNDGESERAHLHGGHWQRRPFTAASIHSERSTPRGGQGRAG